MRLLSHTYERFTWLLIITAMMLAGCAGSAIQIAETPSQKAYALERSYNIILESAVDLVADSSTPDSVKQAIGRIHATATPVMDSLSDAITDYVVASAQFSQGQTTSERMDVVSRNLDMWINQAERAISDLSQAVAGGG